MRFSCKSCQATFQTATGAPATAGFRCPSCNGEMAAVAEVVELYQDRIPTRRYDLDDLRARLDLEREEFAKSRGAPRSADQVWFAAVQGRQVGPLSVAGIAGLRARGQLSAASLVWREGWPSWVAAEAVPELRQILGLPEETLGQPFPVQPAEPAPPPFESTYAAARSQPPGEPLVESSFDPSAARAAPPAAEPAPLVAPALPGAASSADPAPAPASPPSTMHGAASAPGEPDDARAGTPPAAIAPPRQGAAAPTLDITDAAPLPAPGAAASPRTEPPIGVPRAGDLTDPDARVPEALLRSFAALDRATAAAAAERSLPFDAPAPESAPPIPVTPPFADPAAPPALPLADARALEQAATAVLAEARSGRAESLEAEPPLGPGDRTHPGAPAPLHLLDADRAPRTPPPAPLALAPVPPSPALDSPPSPPSPVASPASPSRTQLHDPDRTLRTGPLHSPFADDAPMSAQPAAAAPAAPSPPALHDASGAAQAAPEIAAGDFPPQSSFSEPEGDEEVTAPGNAPSRPPPTRGYRGKPASKGRGHGGRGARSSPPPAQAAKEARAGRPVSAATPPARPPSNPNASAPRAATAKPVSRGSAPSSGEPLRRSPADVPVVDLSAAAPADELAPRRRSRGPSQQSWFGAEEPPPATDSRSKLLFLVVLALIVAVLAIWFRR